MNFTFVDNSSSIQQFAYGYSITYIVKCIISASNEIQKRHTVFSAGLETLNLIVHSILSIDVLIVNTILVTEFVIYISNGVL